MKELSNYMLRLNSIYGKYYNKKHNRVGYVFRDRFKSEVICDEKHLHNCIKYIYNNPVKAGICKMPEEYQYSNYKPIKSIMNDDIIYSFIDIEEEMEKEYKDFISNYLNEKNIESKDLENKIEVLKEIIDILHNRYNLSLRKISEELNVNRERIRTISKKEWLKMLIRANWQLKNNNPVKKGRPNWQTIDRYFSKSLNP